MKTNRLSHLLNSSMLLGISLLVFACNQQDHHANSDTKAGQNDQQNQKKGALALGTQDNIQVDLDVIEPSGALQKVTDMFGYIKIKEGSTAKPLNRLSDSVDRATLVSWQEEAIALHTAANDSRPYVPALQISYGLISGKQQMHMMFQPVCLHQTGINMSTNIATYTLEPKYAGNAYVCLTASHTYTPTSATDFISNYVNTYTVAIRIEHDGAHWDGYTKDDPLSAVYPFQEIFRILDDNTKDTLKIWNVCDKIQSTFRHNLLLSSCDLDPLRTLTTFKGKYGDLSHLCPPSCGSYTYQVVP